MIAARLICVFSLFTFGHAQAQSLEGEVDTASIAATSTRAVEASDVVDEELETLDADDLDLAPTGTAPPLTAWEPVLNEERTYVVDEIRVAEQRISEPARPDTQLRLTGKQLRERGVTNLAQALDMVIDTAVRAAGRGGYQANVRGARKGGILVLIDGVPMSDVYNGNFDLTSIPSTDVAEIRVALTPASPIDGPNGNGGVIEILTRSARGPSQVRGEFQASTIPGGTAAVSARSTIPGDVGVRLSFQGNLGNRAYPITLGDDSATLREDARSGTANLRLEKAVGQGSVRLDAGFTRRRFIVPPSELDMPEILKIDREDQFRGVLAYEMLIGQSTFAAKAYSLVLDRTSRRPRDLSFSSSNVEDLFAHRSGGSVQLDIPLASNLRFTAVTHLMIEGGGTTLTTRMGNIFESSGSVAITEPAAGISWNIFEGLQLDASAGVAIPVGVDASPWPEAKIWVTATPTTTLQLRLTGVRKGRAPVVRERFEIGTGNVGIDPEMGTSAELDAIYKPRAWLTASASAYFRLTDGLIRLNAMRTQLANVGDIQVGGFEARVEVSPLTFFSAGVAYGFARATSVELGEDPLDFFPRHRGEVWATARWNEDLGLWSRLRYTGERIDNGVTLFDYVTFDASVFYRIDDDARVTLRGENLLDQGYELRSTVPGFGRTLFIGFETTI